MNALRPIPLAGAEPLRSTFTAFRVVGDGKPALLIRTTGGDLADVVAEAVQHCQPREHLTIREEHPVTRKQGIHTYAIRQRSKARWVLVDHVSTAVREIYAELLFSLPMDEFVPVVPWEWAPGCDAVGGDRGVVEVACG